MEKPATFVAPIVIGRLGQDERGLFYDYVVRITLGETNIEGTVSHDQFARLFGKARELFGLECLPNFTNIGREYVLHTYEAHYKFRKNFYFGDTVIVRIRVLRVKFSSFELGVEFINGQTNETHVAGTQIIACTDRAGTLIRIPNDLKGVLFNALSLCFSKAV